MVHDAQLRRALGLAAVLRGRLARRGDLALERLHLRLPRRLGLLDELQPHRLEVLTREHVLRELVLGLLELVGPLRARLVVLVLVSCRVAFARVVR